MRQQTNVGFQICGFRAPDTDSDKHSFVGGAMMPDTSSAAIIYGNAVFVNGARLPKCRRSLFCPRFSSQRLSWPSGKQHPLARRTERTRTMGEGDVISFGTGRVRREYVCAAAYSMVRMSVNPVTSKISMIVSPTWVTVMPPFLLIFFWAASSTRRPAEEM